MELPRRLSDNLKKKLELLDLSRERYDSKIRKLQNDMLTELLSSYVTKFDVESGKILNEADNYKMLVELDTVFENFQKTVYETLIPVVNKAVDNLVNISNTYFTISFKDTDLPARFKSILNKTKLLTDTRLGLKGGKVVRGGNFWTLIKGGTDNRQLKQFISRAVSSGMNMTDFVKELKRQIIGTDEKVGMFERQTARFAYDIYGQYDAAYNAMLAKEFHMEYFLYQGGLVKDSRDFCIAHNRKVYTTEEAETWKTWTPQQSLEKGEFPGGYEPTDDLYETPGYMNYEGYDPLVDRGGYNCRHILGYITEELAFKLRPELRLEKEGAK